MVAGFGFGFSPDGKLLAITAELDTLHVWDVAAGKQWFKWKRPNHLTAFTPVFAPDGQRLACSLDGKLYVLKFQCDADKRS